MFWHQFFITDYIRTISLKRGELLLSYKVKFGKMDGEDDLNLNNNWQIHDYYP